MASRTRPPFIRDFQMVASVIGTGATRATAAALSWEPGDIIVALSGVEGASTNGVPTATGLAFTSKALNTTANTCGSRAAVAVATTKDSQIVSMTSSAAGSQSAIAVWAIGGTDSSVTSVKVSEQHTATRTVALVPTDAHSLICYATFDFNADPVVAVTPTPTNARAATQGATHYTVYFDDLTDQPSTTSVSYGVGGAGPGAFSILVVELVGVNMKPRPRSNVAVQQASTWMKKHRGILVPDLWLPTPART